MRKNKAGFTLIELLVVVLIIGILASIAIPQYFKVVEKGRVAQVTGVIANIKRAQDSYQAKGGYYTANFLDLDLSYEGMTAVTLPTKFFTVGLVTTGCTPGDQSQVCYFINFTRHINNGSVAKRYGAYSLRVDLPTNPTLTVAGCPGGGSNCNELLN
ncbi:MAG: prepilin-type N-terminal cleavage/methylation domain-containing protein [Elusimicrobia bacterium]|nr:prepilin-type N-terminal cleavage/methylation domain-containing protein [Elusimicrobiota bacterium]